jgi:glycosyltransferase involved in cell wall biosynthesis
VSVPGELARVPHRAASQREHVLSQSLREEDASCMKRVLLVSNRVMHYRVSVYNYFCRKFQERGWELVVRSNELQKENPYPLNFDFKEVKHDFYAYKLEIEKIKPEVVIIFLHLRELMIWPLVCWLKFKNIPVVFWSKALNYDKPTSLLSYSLYKFMHGLVDGLILYSKQEITHISKRHHSKVFIASNTVNFEDYPEVKETREEIKREFNIPFDKVVLSVGRMGVDGGRKKLNHLIAIFNGEMPQGVGLVIVGSGVRSDMMGKMNKSNTIYLGQVHDSQNLKISKIFRMADVFSIPGHVGLGLNQAMYWGLPVVTEEGSQPPEIGYLINGRNGFIVPNNDVRELRSKILLLLENNDVRQSFSRNAKEDIVRQASIENMFTGFMQCVESLARIE